LPSAEVRILRIKKTFSPQRRGERQGIRETPTYIVFWYWFLLALYSAAINIEVLGERTGFQRVCKRAVKKAIRLNRMAFCVNTFEILSVGFSRP
jgi:hypothetical protein